jgi:hypothetical protein
MKIFNKHDRAISTSLDDVGQVIDTLSGPEDALWPHEKWPPIILDSALEVGSAGGHGPVRYRVSEYIAGRRAAFQFDQAGILAGMDGLHYFEVIPRRRHVIIRHVLEGDCDFGMWLKFTFVVRPMHNALIEDAFDKVESKINGKAAYRSHGGLWVRFLRWTISRKMRRLKTLAKE